VNKVVHYTVLTPKPSECGAAGVWTVKSLSGFVSPPPGGQASKQASIFICPINKHKDIISMNNGATWRTGDE